MLVSCDNSSRQNSPSSVADTSQQGTSHRPLRNQCHVLFFDRQILPALLVQRTV